MADWQSERRARDERLAAGSKFAAGKMVAPSDTTALLETVIRPGDRICLEGDNQKQADFLAACLAKADPKVLYDLHAMDEATTESAGLAAIRGLKLATLEPICRTHGAYVAIVNGEDQLLVGGTRKSLDGVVHDARAAGAKHTTILPLAIASHTPLLAGASDRFRQALTRADLPAAVPADVRLLSGIDGPNVFDVQAGADKLARQIKQTVDWLACMQSCRAAGATKVVELGPGNALARLMHEFMPNADVHSLWEFHSLSGFEHWVQRAPA